MKKQKEYKKQTKYKINSRLKSDKICDFVYERVNPCECPCLVNPISDNIKNCDCDCEEAFNLFYNI